jgi:hypothetical protein
MNHCRRWLYDWWIYPLCCMNRSRVFFTPYSVRTVYSPPYCTVMVFKGKWITLLIPDIYNHDNVYCRLGILYCIVSWLMDNVSSWLINGELQVGIRNNTLIIKHDIYCSLSQLFCNLKEDDGVTFLENFSTFPFAFMSMFQVLTQVRTRQLNAWNLDTNQTILYNNV